MKHLVKLFMALILISCSTPSEKDPVQEIRVERNKNVETLGIIYSLSEMGDFILKNYGGTEKYQLIRMHRKQFDDFKNHSAVAKVNELTKLGLIGLGSVADGVLYSDLPKFNLISKLWYERSHDSLTVNEIEEKITQLYEEYRKFYADANMDDYFNKSAKFYNKALEEVNMVLPNENVLEAMESFFGVTESKKNYVIIPSPTIFMGFNHSSILEKEDSITYFHIAGASYEPTPILENTYETNKEFNVGFEDREYIAELAIHEFGHTFLRFLDKKENDLLVQELKYLNVDTLKNAMNLIGYDGNNWINTFEELTLRASEVVIWENLGNQEKASEKLKLEIEQDKLLYVNEFISLIKYYNEHREQYKTLEDYLPEMVEKLKITVPNNGYKT